MLAFRRAKCNVLAISVPLGGLKPEANYEVEFIDEQRQKTSKVLSGRVLSTDLPLVIPERGASLLVRYRQREEAVNLSVMPFGRDICNGMKRTVPASLLVRFTQLTEIRQ